MLRVCVIAFVEERYIELVLLCAHKLCARALCVFLLNQLGVMYHWAIKLRAGPRVRAERVWPRGSGVGNERLFIRALFTALCFD